MSKRAHASVAPLRNVGTCLTHPASPETMAKISASTWFAVLAVVCSMSAAAHGSDIALNVPATESAAPIPLQLSPSTIRAFTNGSKTVLVAFLARPAPHFEAELVKLNNELAGSDELQMAVANCAQHRSLINTYGLTIFPAVRVFPAGLVNAPFVVDFEEDLGAEKMRAILGAYAHSARGMPSPLYDDSVAAARQFLFGDRRGHLPFLKEATVRHGVSGFCAQVLLT